MASIQEFFGVAITRIYVKIEGYYFDLTDCPAHSRRFLQKYHLKDATVQFNAIRSHGGIDLQNLRRLNKINITGFGAIDFFKNL